MDNLSDKTLIVIACLFVLGTFFTCVGAVVSLRWLVARELALRSFITGPKRRKALVAKWTSERKPAAHTSTVAAPPRAEPGEPLRLAPGPRDW